MEIRKRQSICGYAVSVAISLKQLGGIADVSLTCSLQSALAPRTALCPPPRCSLPSLIAADMSWPGTLYHCKVYGEILTTIDYTIYEETVAVTAAARFASVLMMVLSALWPIVVGIMSKGQWERPASPNPEFPRLLPT